MKDAELLIDVMESNVIYTVKSLSLLTNFTVQKTARIIQKMVSQGYLRKVRFDLDIALKMRLDYGYMLKVD